MTLRIQKSAKGRTLIFALSGRIEAEEVPELLRLFRVEGQGHRIVFDLRGVKLVDGDAVRYLACCKANGIQLNNCPPYIGEWIRTLWS
jgi:anti-anti-sigma regulatory factor